VKQSTVSKNHTEELPWHTVYSNKKTTPQIRALQRSPPNNIYC
jgi:polyphosphate kinase 2 (PPK2 family)